jgi:hypothetical protein
MKGILKKHWLAICIGIIATAFVVYKAIVLNIVWAGVFFLRKKIGCIIM